MHGAPDRKVEVSARVVGDELRIEVLNQGDPVPAASIDKIFAPFWRQSTSARREGLGLGLHISDQIAKAHGGSIQVSLERRDRHPLHRGAAARRARLRGGRRLISARRSWRVLEQVLELARLRAPVLLAAPRPGRRASAAACQGQRGS